MGRVIVAMVLTFSVAMVTAMPVWCKLVRNSIYALHVLQQVLERSTLCVLDMLIERCDDTIIHAGKKMRTRSLITCHWYWYDVILPLISPFLIPSYIISCSLFILSSNCHKFMLMISSSAILTVTFWACKCSLHNPIMRCCNFQTHLT